MLQLLFNMATVSPTSTPTRSPTRWYQAPGHRQNVSQLQDTVAAMQSRMDQLERDATTFATQSAVDARLAAIGDRVTLVDETVTVGVSDLATLLGTVNASLLSAVGEVDRSVGAIRAALREAAVPATGGTPVRTAPSVGADGDSVVVKARGTIRVESASCAVDGKLVKIQTPTHPPPSTSTHLYTHPHPHPRIHPHIHPHASTHRH